MKIEELKLKYETEKMLLSILVEADTDLRKAADAINVPCRGDSAEDRKALDEMLYAKGMVSGLGKAYDLISSVVYEWKSEYEKAASDESNEKFEQTDFLKLFEKEFWKDSD